MIPARSFANRTVAVFGLARTGLSDAERVEQGGRLFDGLYALFGDRR